MNPFYEFAFPAYFQLNNVYSKADRLNKWFKKVRIDSFSKGSVLVDYFVELADVSRDINTQEIKQMFHNALTIIHYPFSIVPLSNSSTSEYDEFESDSDELQAKPLKVKDSFLMGKFVLDPAATDFIGNFHSYLIESPIRTKYSITGFLVFEFQLFQNNEYFQLLRTSNKIH